MRRSREGPLFTATRPSPRDETLNVYAVLMIIGLSGAGATIGM